MPWPREEREAGRGIKTTPFHCRLDAAGASWGCVSGWERPNWFSNTADGESLYFVQSILWPNY
jgi:glycine cleavage system aminomethyltransferase T